MSFDTIAILAVFLLPLAILLLPLLLIAGAIWLIIRASHNNDSGPTVSPGVPQAIPRAVPKPAKKPVIPERNYFLMREEGIKHYWSLAFYGNLEAFTSGTRIFTNRRLGLIYYYIVDGQIRYIGQTRENSLRWRMTRYQENGRIGYNMAIKRNLLNAASKNRLRIKTKAMPKAMLDKYEKAEIKRYGPTNRLWNQKDNPYFDPKNFYR